MESSELDWLIAKWVSRFFVASDELELEQIARNSRL